MMISLFTLAVSEVTAQELKESVPMEETSVETSSGDFFSSPFPVCWGKSVPLKNRGPMYHYSNASDFYVEVQKDVEAYIQENLDENKAILECIESRTSLGFREGCEPLPIRPDPRFEGEAPDIFKLVATARGDLALAGPYMSKEKAILPNTELESYGYRPKPWKPLGSTELEFAEKNLSGFQKSFIQIKSLTETQFQKILDQAPIESWRPGPGGTTRMTKEQIANERIAEDYRSMIGNVRMKHLERYRETIARYPVLNYIDAPTPNWKDIENATRALLKNGEGELRRIQAIKNKNINSNSIPKNSRSLLQYSSIVNQVLSRNPQYCPAATKEHTYDNVMKTLKSAAYASPFVIAAFIPPVAAMTVGLSTALHIAHRSYENRQTGIQAAYSAFTNHEDKRAYSQSEVDTLNSEFEISLAMLPLEVVGSGFISKGVQKMKGVISKPK